MLVRDYYYINRHGHKRIGVYILCIYGIYRFGHHVHQNNMATENKYILLRVKCMGRHSCVGFGLIIHWDELIVGYNLETERQY